MLELVKLRKDINWLVEQVKCLWAKSSLETALSATKWTPNHTKALNNQYKPDTFVWFQGQIYNCIKENEGVNPTNTKYWKCLGPGYLLQEELTEWEQIMDKPEIVNDKTYIHIQSQANNMWTIDHNLNKFPSVTVVDSANNTVFGNIKHINTNRVSVVFTSAFSGKAFCN